MTTEREGLSKAEPAPKKNESAPIWDLVVQDIVHRDTAGRLKYGTPLQAFNGRDQLVDAYQEALDLVVYLRAEIEERVLRRGEASRVINDYLHSDDLAGKNLAQSVLIDARELLKQAGL